MQNVALAASITRDASRQSYLTIRWLADRAHRADAFALYAYFRWLDDMVDEHLPDEARRLAFVARQRALLERAVVGGHVGGLCPEEGLLEGLVRPAGAGRDVSGAVASVGAMLDVMAFDAGRRGRAIGQAELDAYTSDLAVAVTEALHHCIGHGCASPHDGTRYVAVTGAHVAHMLRDLVEDLAAGYLNVPAGLLGPGAPSRDELAAPEVRDWVRGRVALARSCFVTGRGYLARVESRRCRLAGHAYLARFEWVLDAIEADGYVLRESYRERSTARGGLRIAVDGARSAAGARRTGPVARRPARVGRA